MKGGRCEVLERHLSENERCLLDIVCTEIEMYMAHHNIVLHRKNQKFPEAHDIFVEYRHQFKNNRFDRRAAREKVVFRLWKVFFGRLRIDISLNRVNKSSKGNYYQHGHRVLDKAKIQSYDDKSSFIVPAEEFKKDQGNKGRTFYSLSRFHHDEESRKVLVSYKNYALSKETYTDGLCDDINSYVDDHKLEMDDKNNAKPGSYDLYEEGFSGDRQLCIERIEDDDSGLLYVRSEESSFKDVYDLWKCIFLNEKDKPSIEIDTIICDAEGDYYKNGELVCNEREIQVLNDISFMYSEDDYFENLYNERDFDENEEEEEEDEERVDLTSFFINAGAFNSA
jgi:hypothetical protein